MWTAANRKSDERKGLRYPSDMTDAEWALARPLVDVRQHGQGRRRVDLREVLNAVFYIIATGCQWRALPRSTVHDYFIRWQCDRTLSKLHHELYVQAREQAGKEASPTPAIVDSQSVKSAERGAEPDPVGYDAGKKIKGRKRHAVVDTLGLMLGVAILPADIQDRDGCLPALKEVRRLFPFLQRIVADGGYQAPTPPAPFARPPGHRLRSSSDRIPPRASWCCRSAGSSNAPSAGSTAADASPRTSNTASEPRSPSSRSR